MRILAGLIWLLLLALGLVRVTAVTGEFVTAEERLLAPPPLSRLDDSVIAVMTLGHQGLYDDLLELWTLQLLADSRLPTLAPERVYEAVKAATRHHPKVESLYLLACFVLATDLRLPRRCVDVLHDGMQALPDAWRLPMTAGFILAGPLGDPGRGALYYRLAASRAGAPAYLAGLANRLERREPLTVEQRRQAMKELFDAVGGSDVGARILERLQPATGGGSSGSPHGP